MLSAKLQYARKVCRIVPGLGGCKPLKLLIVSPFLIKMSIFIDKAIIF